MYSILFTIYSLPILITFITIGHQLYLKSKYFTIDRLDVVSCGLTLIIAFIPFVNYYIAWGQVIHSINMKGLLIINGRLRKG